MKFTILIASATLCLACGVTSNAPEQQGVTDTRPDAEAPANHGSRDGGSPDGGGAPALVAKARGFYVFSLEYNSSASVGLLGLDGKVLSKSVISSGSELPGLSLGLGTDVVPPTQRQVGGEIVLIDRTNHAVDWVDISKANVTRQVGVGPGGFAANPYDYALAQPDLAAVTRFETNGSPGKATLDEGGDVLVFNPQTGDLLGRVDFNEMTKDDASLRPRPTKLVHHEGQLYVVLGMLATDWTPVKESVLAVIDPQRLEITTTLGLGLRNCEDVSLSPSGETLAIACKGGFADEPITKNSGIVLVDVSKPEPEVRETFGAATLAGSNIGTLDFASESLLVFSSYGNFDPSEDDAARTLDLESSQVSAPILQTSPYQLGHIRCVPEERVCVMANADAFAVQFFEVTADEVTPTKAVEFDADLGLPPRYIGVF